MRNLKTAICVTTVVIHSMILASSGYAQEAPADPDWATIKQAMIEVGKKYDSAWDLYEAFEREAENPTHNPREVPNWSGVWHRQGGGGTLDPDQVGRQTTAKLKGRYAEMLQEEIEKADAGFIWDPHSGCGMPRGYPGVLRNGRPHEFAVTPQQTWHMGQARDEIRRIYTDGRGHTPEEWAYETPHGDTIGFWDGDKLITHTMYTDGGWIGRVQPYLSPQLEGTEVWQKIDDETLQADVWIYDPEALEEPWYTRQVYEKFHQEPGSPLRLAYWWNCQEPNNMVVPTEDGGTTFLDLDFTDVDDPPAGENRQ